MAKVFEEVLNLRCFVHIQVECTHFHEFGEHEGVLMNNVFVALDDLAVPTLPDSTTAVPTTVNNSSCANSSGNDCNGDVEIDDVTIAEGDEHRLEITGGTHASILSLENPE